MNVAIFLFLFFFCCTNATKYQIHKKTNGFDHRPNITESSLQLQRIRKYFENKRLLDTLENPQIPLHVKTRMVTENIGASSVDISQICRSLRMHIEDRNIKPPNIYAGGLMRDFLFDIEDSPK